MSRRSYTISVAVLVFFVVSQAVPALAQGKRPERKNVQVKGSIEGVERGIAKVVDDDKGEWLVKMDNKATFTYSATAEPEWLRRGMWVRFTIKFNAKGEPQETLKDVVVFTPKKEDKLGVYNQNKSPITNPFTKSLSNVPESERLQAYTVAARIKTIKADELSVVVGRLTIAVPMGERTKIRVEIPDPSLIRQGDAVSIRGWQVPGSENAVVATSLSVTAKEPLAPPNKKRPRSKDSDAKKDKTDKS
jgi:hypothetical protein